MLGKGGISVSQTSIFIQAMLDVKVKQEQDGDDSRTYIQTGRTTDRQEGGFSGGRWHDGGT